MSTSGYTYDQRARRFRQPDGRFVARRDMLAARDRVAAHHERLALDLAEQWIAGRIPGEQYVRGMRALLKTTTLQQYMLGRGGRHMMTAADRGRVGGTLTREYRYLNRMAESFAAGKIDAEAVRSRTAMYLDSTVRMYERGLTAAWGVVDALPEIPPLHPGCRCNLAIAEDGEGGKRVVKVYWRTDRDPCPICAGKAADMSPLVIPMPV